MELSLSRFSLSRKSLMKTSALLLTSGLGKKGGVSSPTTNFGSPSSSSPGKGGGGGGGEAVVGGGMGEGAGRYTYCNVFCPSSSSVDAAGVGGAEMAGMEKPVEGGSLKGVVSPFSSNGGRLVEVEVEEEVEVGFAGTNSNSISCFCSILF
ncbi:hypothetical protein HPP92_009524 [Vanilla planifolia]|uniref:Uncharacterized protein n=1 Tax=Vanilla planifolia TaxID=51239 RepID=A0A835RAF6_VANPL|nr:hypothetical protein HPP92_009524 [Vanilla planifolia]